MSGITIGSNISALRAIRREAEASSTFSRSLERLASGQRINRASDDAAGLAITSALRSQSTVFAQALRNVSDGQSLLAIAQSSLGELTSLSVRLRELASQSANGTYSLQQRRAMNDEATALVEEHNRIVQSVDFNGLRLLERSISELRLQAGYGSDGSIAFALSRLLARRVSSGSYDLSPTVTFGDGSLFDGLAGAVVDLNSDGLPDLVGTEFGAGSGSGLIVRIGNGDGTFQSAVTYSTGAGPFVLGATDFDGDGIQDLAVSNVGDGEIAIYLGNGDGSLRNAITTVLGFESFQAAFGDINGDGTVDIVAADSVGSVHVLLGGGNGTFSMLSTSYSAGTDLNLSLADFNGDGIEDLFIANHEGGTGSTINVFIGRGDGSFAGAVTLTTGLGPNGAVGDIDRNGTVDIVSVDLAGSLSVFLGNGDGTFGPRTSFAIAAGLNSAELQDVNGDGLYDLVTADVGNSRAVIFVGNGDGTFDAAISYVGVNGGAGTSVADFNGDGAKDLLHVNPSGDAAVLLARPAETTSLPYLNLALRDGALDAMSTIDASLSRIASELGAIGSTQSRLLAAAATLAVARENLLAADARISSTDVASEAAGAVRARILQEVSAAVLAQANQAPELALTLLNSQ